MGTENNTTDASDRVIADIMRRLDVEGEVLPEQAIRDAQQHKSQIIPRLIQSLEDATRRAATGDIPEDNAHFYALFLLTEFQAKEALPAILDAISLPGELPFDLFGDAITENLSSVLATMASDNTPVIDSLIQNRSCHEYVRGAAMGVYLYWVRDGLMSREDAAGRLSGFLREAIADKDTTQVTALVCDLVSFIPDESILTDIREAFRLNLVDPLMVNWEFVERCVSDGESHYQRELELCRRTGVEDTVQALKGWYYPDQKKTPSIPTPMLPGPVDEGDDDIEYFRDSGSTIRNTHPHVGRNDPCPCGSGKKFKKCCQGAVERN